MTGQSDVINELKQEIRTKKEDIENYKTSSKRERNRNESLTQKIQELSNMLKVMNVDELSVEFLSLQQELKKQSDKINQLTSEKERQQRVLTEKDAMNRNLQDEILSLQQQVNEQLDNGELISEID